MKSDSEASASDNGESDTSSIGLDLPDNIIPFKQQQRNKSSNSGKHQVATKRSLQLPGGRSRPPLSQFALHHVILVLREAGRRLTMSDVAVARGCTLMHRVLSVLICGRDAALHAEDDSSNTSPPHWVSMEDIKGVEDVSSAMRDQASPSGIKRSIRASLGDVDPHTLGMACLNLAGKIQEEHQRLRDVVLAYHRCLNPNSKKASLDPGDDYDRLRETLVQTELFIMRLLSFDVRQPTLPHSHLLHYITALSHWLGKGIAFPVVHAQPSSTDGGAQQQPTNTSAAAIPESQMSEKALALARLPGVAWSLLADSYHTALCVEHRAEHIAAAILHLSLRIAGVEVPGNRQSEYAWWQAISYTLDREIVEKIQMKVMLVYGADDLMPAGANS